MPRLKSSREDEGADESDSNESEAEVEGQAYRGPRDEAASDDSNEDAGTSEVDEQADRIRAGGK